MALRGDLLATKDSISVENKLFQSKKGAVQEVSIGKGCHNERYVYMTSKRREKCGYNGNREKAFGKVKRKITFFHNTKSGWECPRGWQSY